MRAGGVGGVELLQRRRVEALAGELDPARIVVGGRGARILGPTRFSARDREQEQRGANEGPQDDVQ